MIVTWEPVDRLRPLTALAVVGAGAVLAMAVAGIPNLPLMWPLYQLGVVLPSCGLTRGVVAFARGDLGGAWRWNPASAVVALAFVVVLVRAAAGVTTGRWLHGHTRLRGWHVTVAAVAIALLWANQWRHADLLMNR